MQKADEVMSHLKEHQKYPATKEDLVAECSNLSDFSEKLAEGTYNSAEDVIKALGLE